MNDDMDLARVLAMTTRVAEASWLRWINECPDLSAIRIIRNDQVESWTDQSGRTWHLSDEKPG